MNDPEKITYFAETDFRNKKTRFGIKAKDRDRHVYVIGKTGMGKSTMLENMAVQDIQNGEGMAFIDPHGGSADKLLEYVPEHRIKDVIYFAPFDLDYPVSFNVMEDIGADKRHLVVSGLMSTFKKIWVDAWSARMEYILSNILAALLESPGSTLLGVNRMLSDKEYRKRIIENVKDPSVKSFWIDEFAKYGDKYMQEAGAAIQNKIGQFTSNPLIRNIIGQSHSSFDVRKLMDEKKILIVNLSKGRVGEQNASLLGGMIITKIYIAAMSRADVSAHILRDLPKFYFYVDEFQSFANESFADILSEARKYKLSLTIAHQYIEQMAEEVRDAVFGNVGTTVAFRVGPFDAEVLEKIFMPTFTKEDIVNLGFAQIYLTLMVDGIGSKPFSARTIASIQEPEISYKDEIIKSSREMNAEHRNKVEEEINKWHEPIIIEKKPKTFDQRDDRQPQQYSQNKPQNYERRDQIPRSYQTQLPRENHIRQEIHRDIPRPVIHMTPRPPHSTVRAPKPALKLEPAQDSSQKLKELLHKLEANVEVKQEPVHLSSLKQNPVFSKEPSQKNISALKDVLAKAMGNKINENKTEVNKQKNSDRGELGIGNNSASNPKINPIDPTIRKPKEVPEDVLNKILE